MSFGIAVKGGTGAGSKRPLLPANTIPWQCNCLVEIERSDAGLQTFTGKQNPGYLRKCIDCGVRRP
jgi:hypothetical protein